MFTEESSALQKLNLMVKNIPSSLKEKEVSFFRKIQANKTNPIKKLELIYEIMDLLYDYVTRYTPCNKGCSYCCHYEVSVSAIEIQYIELHARKTRRKEYLKQQNFHGTPCPFLINNSCSIYKARPFVCRRHVVFTATNTYCHHTVSLIKETSLLKFTEVESSFLHVKLVSNSNSVFDIRQVFAATN